MEARRADRGASEATPRKYCSAACRKRKVNRTDRALEAAILKLLDARSAAATICPSEAARAVSSEAGQTEEDGWRELMEPARRAARRLVVNGECVITQKNRIVDPSTAKGPIRIRRVRP